MNDVSAAQTHSPCLRATNLSVRRGEHTVLRDISLAVERGVCLSIVGPNGSGKTTLLLTLLGLLRPASGTVELDGRNVQRLSARARGRLAGYVPQVLDAAPALSVRDVVIGGRFAHLSTFGRLSGTDTDAVELALARCGVAALAERPFNTLSGGERQKALIAAAIAQDPQVLLLDEPNAGLDPAVQQDLVRILQDWQQSGRALLLVSHDLQLPMVLGGRVIALRAGQVAAEGPADEVLTPERLGAIYAARFGTATMADGRSVIVGGWHL